MRRSDPTFSRSAKLLAATLLACGLTMPAAAQVGRFNGGGVVFAYSQACRDAGWNEATTEFNVRYQPANLGSNGNRETLALYAPWGALTFDRTGGPFSTAYQAVDSGGSFRAIFFIPRTAPNAARIRVTSRAPTPTASLRTPVRLVGDIQNWSGITNCNVRFDIVVGQKIP